MKRRYQQTNGNLSEEIRPGSRTTTFGYDAYGRVTSLAAPGLATRTIHYDPVNRPDTVFDGVHAQPTSFVYDSLASWGGHFTRVRDPAGNVYVNYLNEVGWSGGREDPNGAWDNYQYNRDGDVVKWMDRRGDNTFLQYDALHRLVKRYGDSVQTDSVAYGASGLLVTAISPASTETSYLNSFGQPDSVRTTLNGRDYWRRYGYTTSGLPNTLSASGSSDPFQTRTYGYAGQLGTMDSISLNGALTRFVLNGNLQPSSVVFPGGDQVGRTFTALNGEILITSNAPYNTDTERKISYDAPGRLSRQLRDNMPLNQGLAHLYTYDGLGRLLTDTTAGKLDTTPACTGQDPLSGMQCSYDYDFWSYWWVMSRDSFAYDAAGNRLDRGGSYSTMGNRITAFDGCSYTTDPDGNVAQRSCPGQTLTIHWDALNRPDSFNLNGTALRLWYDAAGRPVRRDVAGTPDAYFLWDGDNLLAELDGSAVGKRTEYSYYPGLDNLHAVMTGGTREYAQYEGVGNVVALTKEDQTSDGIYSYDAWGANGGYFKGALNLVPQAGEFYYMRARWYEPRTGRFLSEDPIGLGGGINPYVYAGNNPVNGRDPTGTYCEPYHWTTFEPDPDGLGGSVVGHTIWVCGGGGGEPGEVPPAGDWPNVGPGAPQGPQQPQVARAVTYVARAQCPATNAQLLRLLNAELTTGTAEGRERGGYYQFDAHGNATAPMTGTNRQPGRVSIPFQPGAAGFWHIHIPGFGQGPSDFDSTLAARYNSPLITRSSDSLFFTYPTGQTVGCAR